MTYSVSWGYCAEVVREVETLDQAIVIALTVRHGWGGRKPRMSVPPRILGDGVDADCDGDGFFMCSDGLDEDERERIQMAGL